MRKIKDSKLGFEVGSGLKKSQSKYNYEATCKLYGGTKDININGLKEKEQTLSIKIRRLKIRIKLQGTNPNPVWKKNLKVAQEELKNIQKKMLNYFKESK